MAQLRLSPPSLTETLDQELTNQVLPLKMQDTVIALEVNKDKGWQDLEPQLLQISITVMQKNQLLKKLQAMDLVLQKEPKVLQQQDRLQVPVLTNSEEL